MSPLKVNRSEHAPQTSAFVPLWSRQVRPTVKTLLLYDLCAIPAITLHAMHIGTVYILDDDASVRRVWMGESSPFVLRELCALSPCRYEANISVFSTVTSCQES